MGKTFRKLLKGERTKMEKQRVVIIGGGPAGLTAAIYTARANLNPLVIEGIMAGGQLMETTSVENFPGFPQGITGPELMQKMKEQAKRFNVKFIPEDATEVKLQPTNHIVKWTSGNITTLSIIIATGAGAKSLGIKGEDALSGKGVSRCATCDGFFFKGKEVAVIGGGDSALEEAIYLSTICKKVKIIHRRDKLRASAYMQQKARKTKNIEFLLERIPLEFLEADNGTLGAIKLKHVKTQRKEILQVDGAFVAIGHQPSTSLFSGQLELNQAGYIVTEKGSSRTSVEGVFAAGDVCDPTYRQAITAAAGGCMAAIDATRYIESLNLA